MAGDELAHEAIWLKEHSQLCLLFAAPLRARVFIWSTRQNSKELVCVAEVPAGAKSSLISLPSPFHSPTKLFWTAFGDRQAKKLVGLVDGPPLEPKLGDTGHLSVQWSQAGWHGIRIRRLVWDADQLLVEELEHAVPAAEETEWLLTPVDRDQNQGPTHRLIAPPQSARIIVTLSAIPQDQQDPSKGPSEEGGVLVRFRKIGGGPPPDTVVHWRFRRPRQEQVRSFPVEWRSDDTALVSLDTVTLQDSIEVDISSTLDPIEYIFEVRFFDPARKLWTIRRNAQNSEGHWAYLWMGPTVKEEGASSSSRTIAPLPYLERSIQYMRQSPIASEIANGDSEDLLNLPSVVLNGLVQLGGDLNNWRRVSRILGVEPGRGLASYLQRAQDYGLLLGSPRLLDLVGRQGLPLDVETITTRAIVAHALAQQKQECLLDEIDTRGEAELDFCVDALVVSVADIVGRFRYAKGWDCSVSRLMEVKQASRLFEKESFDDLRKELRRNVNSPLHEAVQEAEEATSVALSDNATFSDFRTACRKRNRAQDAFRTHLETLIKSRPTPGPWNDLEQTIPLLKSFRPSGAGKILKSIRTLLAASEEEPDDLGGGKHLQDAVPCLLRIDAMWLSRFARDADAQMACLEQVAGWCFELLDSSKMPDWPLQSRLPHSDICDLIPPAHEEFIARLPCIPNEWKEHLGEQDWVVAVRDRIDEVHAFLTPIVQCIPGCDTVAEVVQSLACRVEETAAVLQPVEFSQFRASQLIVDKERLTSDVARDMLPTESTLHEPVVPALVCEAARILSEDEALWRNQLDALPRRMSLVVGGDLVEGSGAAWLGTVLEILKVRGGDVREELQRERETLEGDMCKLTDAEKQLDVVSAPLSLVPPPELPSPKQLDPEAFTQLSELSWLAQVTDQIRVDVDTRKEHLLKAAKDCIDRLFTPLLPSYFDCRTKLLQSLDELLSTENYSEAIDLTRRLKQAVPVFLRICKILRMSHGDWRYNDYPPLTTMLCFETSCQWCLEQDQELVRQIQRLCSAEFSVCNVTKDQRRLDELASDVNTLSEREGDIEADVRRIRHEMSDILKAAFRIVEGKVGDTMPHVACHEDLPGALQWLAEMTRTDDGVLHAALVNAGLLRREAT